MIVEAQDVKFFEIGEITTPSGRAVRIDGLVFHSSFAVDHIEQNKIDGDLVMDVFLTPAKAGISGRFKIEVPLADNVKRILFGPEKIQIWPAVANSVQTD